MKMCTLATSIQHHTEIVAMVSRQEKLNKGEQDWKKKKKKTSKTVPFSNNMILHLLLFSS